MTRHDIGIAGCGIGGLSAAILLARDGHCVTIYERFAEARPLGSGLLLQPTGMAVLARLGLAGEAICRGARIDRLRGENAAGECVLDARYEDMASLVYGIGIHRADLFAILLDSAIAHGVTIRTSREVAASDLGSVGRTLVFADSRTSPAHDLVVDSLGVSSPLVKRSGHWLPYGALWADVDLPGNGPFALNVLEQRYDRASRMIGVLPTAKSRGALFWSLRADALAKWRSAGLDRWKQEVLQLWPATEVLVAQIGEPDRLTFARYAHHTLSDPCRARQVHIGDAWHAASPQLGQGANMALLDAWALSRALRRAGSIEEGLTLFHEARRGHVRIYQALTALVTPLYQSDSLVAAVLRDLLFAPLSRIGSGPRIQSALVGGLAGAPLRKLGLEMPDYGELAGTNT
jgi:2-polyprenyl-6-methoxyphenol hydroxylase-like FAD-dependent oxidoreductase